MNAASSRLALSRMLGMPMLAIVLLLTGTGCVPVVGGPVRVVAELEDSAGLFVGNDVGVLGVPGLAAG